MATDWKQKHADDSELAFDHAIVDEAVDEYIDNMKSNYAIDLSKGLPGMGLHKVMSAVAQVARAQALGFDLDLLRLSSTEANEEILALARKAVELGKPVVVVDPSAFREERP